MTKLIRVTNVNELGILCSPEISAAMKLMAVVAKPYWITGGYLRDTLNGKPWKDVDIFMPGLEPDGSGGDYTVRYDLMNAVDLTVEGHAINLIQLRPALNFKQVLTRMDLGICQIGFDRGSLYCTQAYLDDVKNKTISVMFKPTAPSDHAHLERIKAKYPDHTVVETWRQPSFAPQLA